MPMFAMDPDGTPLRPEPSSRTEEENAARPIDRALLEKVLHETLSHAHQGSPSGTSLESLREVARLHRGQPLVLEPVAVELIRALLRTSFPKAAHDSREWRSMASRIAQSLLDDPVARERLKVFWGKLTESHR